MLRIMQISFTVVHSIKPYLFFNLRYILSSWISWSYPLFSLVREIWGGGFQEGAIHHSHVSLAQASATSAEWSLLGWGLSVLTRWLMLGEPLKGTACPHLGTGIHRLVKIKMLSSLRMLPLQRVSFLDIFPFKWNKLSSIKER